MDARCDRTRRLAWLASACVAAALAGPARAAEPATQRLRIVGGLAGVNQYVRHEEPFWTRELPRRSDGRLSAEIVPFDRAGMVPQEMLRLVQLGAVPFGTLILSSSAAQDPELHAPDLAGLNPDIATLRRTADATRQPLRRLLHERYGVELLALYIYPAQVTFCRKPFAGLSDLAGRRVRVSSAPQADFVAALGGLPVQSPFAEIVAAMASGNIDCAITGTMSGFTIGLHEVATHVHSMPVNWGMTAFVANGAAWKGLGGEAQQLLRRELATLEQAIWAEAADETGEGVACNVGGAACRSGRKGRMIEVRATPDDTRRRHEILVHSVLPAWIRRCGASCATLWQQTIGVSLGIVLR